MKIIAGERDPLEGFHRDCPEDGITIKNLTKGTVSRGNYSFLNSTNTDDVFVFCMSTSFEDHLWKEFEAEACIEITDVEAFVKKVKFRVKRLISSHKCGLLHQKVNYYQDNAPAGFNIKDPKNLAFAKGVHYEHQDEYRFVFGGRKAFKLTQQVALEGHDFIAEAKKGQAKDKFLEVGSIADIVKVHYA